MECNCACKYTFNTTTGAGSKVKILRGTSPSTPSPNNLHLWPFRKKDNEQYRNTIFLKNESSLSLIYQSQNTNNPFAKLIQHMWNNTNRHFPYLFSWHKNLHLFYSFHYPASISNYCLVFTQASVYCTQASF